MVASGESFLISKGGWDVEDSLGTAVVVAPDMLDGVDTTDFRRFGSGELGSDGGRWSPFLVSVAGGVEALVMLLQCLFLTIKDGYDGILAP